MNAIQHFITRLTGSPKAETQTVECPYCQRDFSIDIEKKSDGEELWRTNPETGETSEKDPANNGVDDDSEILNMHTPKQRADRATNLTKSILNVASDRDSVGAKPHEVSPAESRQF
jgi:hypothetical protein